METIQQSEIDKISLVLDENKETMRKELGFSFDEFNLTELLKKSGNFVEEMMCLINPKKGSSNIDYLDNKIKRKDTEKIGGLKQVPCMHSKQKTKLPFYLNNTANFGSNGEENSGIVFLIKKQNNQQTSEKINSQIKKYETSKCTPKSGHILNDSFVNFEKTNKRLKVSKIPIKNDSNLRTKKVRFNNSFLDLKKQTTYPQYNDQTKIDPHSIEKVYDDLMYNHVFERMKKIDQYNRVLFIKNKNIKSEREKVLIFIINYFYQIN